MNKYNQVQDKTVLDEETSQEGKGICWGIVHRHRLNPAGKGKRGREGEGEEGPQRHGAAEGRDSGKRREGVRGECRRGSGTTDESTTDLFKVFNYSSNLRCSY